MKTVFGQSSPLGQCSSERAVRADLHMVMDTATETTYGGAVGAARIARDA